MITRERKAREAAERQLAELRALAAEERDRNPEIPSLIAEAQAWALE